jgi:hypothetical protein
MYGLRTVTPFACGLSGISTSRSFILNLLGDARLACGSGACRLPSRNTLDQRPGLYHLFLAQEGDGPGGEPALKGWETAKLKGNVAVVTGGAQGMSHGTQKGFSKRGEGGYR